MRSRPRRWRECQSPPACGRLRGREKPLDIDTCRPFRYVCRSGQKRGPASVRSRKNISVEGEPAMHCSAINHESSKPTALGGRPRWLSMLFPPVLAGLALLGMTLWGATAARSQGASPAAPAVKLYIFDLGSLHSANPEPLLQRGVKT